jgi:hypothetical protein
MSYKTIRFERQKLFEQVWEKPMTTLAAEYGLSDVGLRKICKRLSIPLPPQGYHLRTHKGQRPPLPPVKNGETVYTTHTYEPEQRTANEIPQPVEVPEITFEEQAENRIVVPEEPGTLHHLVAEAKRQLKKADPDGYGRVSTSWRGGSCSISVFPASIDRAVRIMNILIKALTKRSYTVSVDEKNGQTLVKVLDEQIGFRLEERSRQTRRTLTPAELKEQKTNPYRSFPAYDYMATGEFSLSFTDGSYAEKVCTDNKKGTIEEKLNLFIIALIKRALKKKDDCIRRAREEEIRRAREQKRWEMDSLIRKEKEKLETLKKQCAAWHESQNLREFIKAAYQSRPQFDPESPFAKWLVWASLQADRMDPLKHSPPSVLDHDRSY